MESHADKQLQISLNIKYTFCKLSIHASNKTQCVDAKTNIHSDITIM